MNSYTHSGGAMQPSTTTAVHSPHLLAIGVIGAALVDHQVHRSATTRARLEGATDMARRLGVLDSDEAQLVANVLARYDAGHLHAVSNPGAQA